ncbi:MAG: hypothetical protein GEV12_23860 [Micromonosporaceae bacterium]|nr:hypothetical protein [Micromonosporaceae bacterium]
MSDQHDPQHAGSSFPPHPSAAEVADQAIGLFLEYRDHHRRSEHSARSAAVQEVLDGLAADLPAPPESATTELGQAAAHAAERPGRPQRTQAADRLAAAGRRQAAAAARVGRCRQVAQEARRQLDEARAATNGAYRRLGAAEEALVGAQQDVELLEALEDTRSRPARTDRGGGMAM